MEQGDGNGNICEWSLAGQGRSTMTKIDRRRDMVAEDQNANVCMLTQEAVRFDEFDEGKRRLAHQRHKGRTCVSAVTARRVGAEGRM